MNFRPGTEITLGEGITIVSPPFVHSPTKATLDILVEPSATPGARAATAVNRDSAVSSGPGAVMVTVARPAKKKTIGPSV